MTTWMKSGLIILASALVSNANPMKTDVLSKPQPLGGIPAMCKHLIYPEHAMDLGLEGNVVLRFKVDELGNVSNIQIIQSGGYLLDEAAMAAVTRTEWIPATQNNQSYSVLFQLPFKFCID